ncbi:OmcA/MtrC family decaheme c-type cytochrome [Paraferrimonas haliotis]|uniref:Cytochrome c n=1 Tax=Paraferrimonas haliotis TaxID=2013866 RepID=A0AA37WXD6_9GAMM|nr:OmcA/MtrC family decaheme c-type cytochrome [Paraferrimonas haliotis]GLS83359.1 cytochrome c [Paraferrimonas haliotis]
MSFKQKALATTVAMALFGLGACGSDGKDGPQGPQGPEGPQGPGAPEVPNHATSAESLNLEYLEAGIDADGIRTTTFKLTNEQGQTVVGLPRVRFLSSQLAMTDAGYSERQSFGYPRCETGEDGCLVDHGDGTYTVTATPENADKYDASLPQRFMVRVESNIGIPGIGPVPDIMPEYDFMVDGSDLTATRAMVATESCNACHTDIAYARYDTYDRSPHYANNVEACSTCHSPDGQERRGIFVQRAHRWHSGLPTNTHVTAAYDCTSCHVTDATEELPNGAEWLAPTANIQSCLGCHGDGDTYPRTEYTHSFGSTMTDSCTNCHSTAQQDHVDRVAARTNARNAFSVNVTDVAVAPMTSDRGGNSYNTAEVTVTLTILDSEGMPVTQAPNESQLFNAMRITAAWDADAGYRMLTTETKADGSLGRLADHSVNYRVEGIAPTTSVPAEGKYTYVISGQLEDDNTKNNTGLIIPSNTDMAVGVLAVEAQVKADEKTGVPAMDGKLVERIRSTTAFFDMNGLVDDSMKRRQVVSNENCASCHGDQAYGMHTRRNDLEQQCVACHNVNMAQWDKTFKAKGVAPEDTVVDHFAWNTYVHALHAQNRAEQNLDETEAKRVFKYPARLNDCAQCHVDGSVNLVAIETTGALITRHDMTADSDFFATSPAAATCYSCHNGEAAKAHMIHSGAATFEKMIDATNATFDGDVVVDAKLPRESCSVCHSEANIAEKHSF